tara:strand:+ start:168 stop:1382 length:1215 start_codon:yes stop_codon:yes gene_type:complete
MKVLSLFDGMSCGQIALDQLGIPVERYYASEIDKYAIKVTQANYPNTIQVGDVCNIDPKDFKDIDLIQAGSPCQGFSFAGKQLAFDDPRSALFFEFIRLLKAIKPKYFLLENVRMKKEFLQAISQQVSECYPEIPFGIEPIFINSSLLSAQSRQRYYWTNIPGIKQPEDRGIVLRDILEDNFDSERDKAHCIDANYYKGANVEQYKKKHRRQLVNKPKMIGKDNTLGHDILKRVYSKDGKSPTVNTCQGGNREPKVAVQSYREVRTDEAKKMRRMTRQKTGKDHTPFRAKKLEPRKDGKVGTITPSLNKDHEISIQNLPDKSQTIKSQYYKSSRANFERQGTFHATGVQQENLSWRKLTPLECERLQTVPDNYTNHVSNTQRYKMLGNGWTVEVIKHIYKNMEY